MAEQINANKEYVPTEKNLSDLSSLISAVNNNTESEVLTDDLVKGTISIDAVDNPVLPRWSQVDYNVTKSVSDIDAEKLFTLNNYVNVTKPGLSSLGTPGSLGIYESSMYGGGNSLSPVSKSTLPQIITDLSMRGFFFGYYYYPGFSMTRDDSPWYITISRHGWNDEYSGVVPKLDNENGLFRKSNALERLPRYLVTVGDLMPTYFDFSTMAPCVGCSINIGEQRMSQVNLFRGQTFDVPDGFSVKEPEISLMMIDDEHGSLRKYLMKYQKTCYDLKTNTSVNWRDVIWDINLVMLRPGPEVDYQYTFYGIISGFNYKFDLQKDGVGDMSIIEVPFSIVGAKVSSGDVVYRTVAPQFVPLDDNGVPMTTFNGINMKDISVFKI